MPTTISKEILAAAIDGFEIQKQQLNAQIAELRQQLTGGSGEPQPTAKPAGKRKKMSAAARKRIADAQRKRWAAVKEQTVVSPQKGVKAAKSKRRLSAEGRQRIIDATKKRWAAVRAVAAKRAK